MDSEDETKQLNDIITKNDKNKLEKIVFKF